MGAKLSIEDIQLYKKIDEILWADWDPIGIKLLDGPRDEYQNYVPQIFSLKKNGADGVEIAGFLFKVEIEYMGLNGLFDRCLAIADKIASA